MKGLRLLNFQNVKKYPYQKERSKDAVILVIGQKLKNFSKQDIHILIEIMTEKPAKLLVGNQINLKLEKLQSKIVMTEIHVLPVCLLYTSPSPRDISGSRMPSSA